MDTILKNNLNTNEVNLLSTSLVYNKTAEEELEEQQKVELAENWLITLGVKTKTPSYGYYRHSYDILKDLGDYLLKNNLNSTELMQILNSKKQDRLIILPCKVGETLYKITEHIKCKAGFKDLHATCNLPIACYECREHYKDFSIDETKLSLFSQLEKFGNTLFLTHEEAEIALEKLQNKKEK